MTNPFIRPDLTIGAPAAELSDTAGAARLRRLRLALHDLGLLRALGRDWVRFEAGRFVFDDLDDPRSDALVLALESFVDGAPASARGTTAAQLDLLDRLTAVSLPLGPMQLRHSAHLALPY